MKPVKPCPDPVPDIRICVGEPALGLAPGSVGTGTAKAVGAARTAIAAAAIIDKAIRVPKRGTTRDPIPKLDQRPYLNRIMDGQQCTHDCKAGDVEPLMIGGGGG